MESGTDYTQTHNIHKQKGPLLLVAGPGTGKTFRLAQRIKFLVEDEGVLPEQVTVITFTNAAAVNMRQRISDPNTDDLFVPPHLQPRIISTMHSLGHKIICDEVASVPIPTNPSVVRNDYLRDMLLGDAAQAAGFTRDDAEETADCRQHGDCQLADSPKCIICGHYREILGKCGAIDHDDQIIIALRMLHEDADLLAKYQESALHLLVDEYQDINSGQFQLIKTLSSNNLEGLFVVGDDDQSIYSWRGASPYYIREFRDDFGPNARSVTLTHAHRCRKNILEAALCVVKSHDHSRLDKGKMTYSAGDAGRVIVHSSPSDKREAEIILAIMEDLAPSRTALILVPTRLYLPQLINQLGKGRFDYSCPIPTPGKGLPILERLACWILNDKDSLALRECIEAIINGKKLGVPSKSSRSVEKKELKLDAYNRISNLWDAIRAKDDSLWSALSEHAKNDPLLVVIVKALEELRTHDKRNVAEFLSSATDLLSPWMSTTSFLDEIQAWVGAFKEIEAGSSPRIRVLTFQGAKGLEADIVCVVGLEQGTLPRKDATDEQLAEQSRLMYVSMTRAREELHLFYSRKRSGAVSFQRLRGSQTLDTSVFINAIPKNLRKDQYHRPKNRVVKVKSTSDAL